MRRRLPLIFVLLTVVIDAIGIGIIAPVMPDLILDVEAGDLGSAAVWGGILASSFAVMQFICSPTIGNLSDRFGRRPVLLVSLFFMSLDYLVMGVAHTIWLLLIGRIIGGITASTQATVAAYIGGHFQTGGKSAEFWSHRRRFWHRFHTRTAVWRSVCRIWDAGSFLRRGRIFICQYGPWIFRAAGDGDRQDPPAL